MHGVFVAIEALREEINLVLPLNAKEKQGPQARTAQAIISVDERHLGE